MRFMLDDALDLHRTSYQFRVLSNYHSDCDLYGPLLQGTAGRHTKRLLGSSTLVCT
jgi:hypothetical protein